MTTSTRWTLVVLAVVGRPGGGAGVAASRRRRPPTERPAGRHPNQSARTHRDADTPEALAGPRRQADLPPCPAAGRPRSEGLRGIVVECAADGAPVDVARALAGRTVVLNLWAYWCASVRRRNCRRCSDTSGGRGRR